MKNVPSHLQENERAAILAFSESVHDFLGADLCHIWLFGSKARGDFHDDSDLDLLIVLRQLDPERRGVIRRLGARASLDYDTLINTHLYEKERWDVLVQVGDALWREIERDGVSLHDLIAEPSP